MNVPVPHSHAMRRDTAADWTAANPVLAAGEEGYETDTQRRKVGDGTTAWTGLPYAGLIAADDMAFSDNGDGTGLISWNAGANTAEVPTVSGGKIAAGLLPDLTGVTDNGNHTATIAEGATSVDVPTLAAGKLDPSVVPPASAPVPTIEEFTASTTWTMDPAATKVFIQLYGAGGAANSSSDGNAGEYKSQYYAASAITAAVTLTVGAGGAFTAGGSTSVSGPISLTARGGAIGSNAPADQYTAALGAPGAHASSGDNTAVGSGGLIRITTYF